MTTAFSTAATPRLGLGENWQQFTLLVVVNGFVGATIGAERSVLPLIAKSEFGLVSATAMLSFLVAFGLTKAIANLATGVLADRVGRRRMLITGWLVALPVPALLWWAPNWNWIIAANVLLGANQGLAWSATVIMKIDLVGPKKRGFAMGLNEFAGYVSVAAAALLAGFLASMYGGRHAAVVTCAGAIACGLALATFFVRDTASHVFLEQEGTAKRHTAPPSGSRFFRLTWQEKKLFAANQAGFINNLNDGVAWGVFPIMFAHGGLNVREIGVLTAIYPATWGLAQIFTGGVSDRVGRRPLIVGGMLLQGVSLTVYALSSGFATWLAAAVLLGLGTAAVYPTLIAHVSDSVTPSDRATGVGVYRFWRDLGYVAGALMTGVLVDLFGFALAIGIVAFLTVASGVASAILMSSAPPTVTGVRGA
jgi:MFS family permease